MKKYVVENPWHGVKKGQVIETDSLHPSLVDHVRPPYDVADELKADEQGDTSKPKTVKELQAEIKTSTNLDYLYELVDDERAGVRDAAQKRIDELEADE